MVFLGLIIVVISLFALEKKMEESIKLKKEMLAIMKRMEERQSSREEEEQ